MKYDLSEALEAVRLAFESAPAWTDPNVKVKQHLRRVDGRAVASGQSRPRSTDPFSGSMRLPNDTASEDAKARYFAPLGKALAYHGRTDGAVSPDEYDLSIARGPVLEAVHYVTVTATPKPLEVRN